MVARHLAVAELEGMQHIANLTMEVSSDANVVVEEGPQTSTIFNVCDVSKTCRYCHTEKLIQKVSTKKPRDTSETIILLGVS